jgi:hypothetical protein
MSSLVSNEDGHDCWRSTFLNQNNPPGYLKDEEDRSLCTDAAKERNSVCESNPRCGVRSISADCVLLQEATAWVAGVEDGAEMEASVGETVKAVGKEDQLEAGVNEAGDAEWVFVPQYPLPLSSPVPSSAKLTLPPYSSEELKGEYRQKMVQEVLPELMDL